jgi:hypothetical protein
MSYHPAPDRYEGEMRYRRCGRSGLDLPVLSLGYWHNFGDERPFETQQAIARRAFDLGITHHDLANNYGPPYGSAELNFGRLMREDSRPYRDEMIVSTEAGWDMWPGPYGQGGGSRKYLLASLDQSLRRIYLPTSRTASTPAARTGSSTPSSTPARSSRRRSGSSRAKQCCARASRFRTCSRPVAVPRSIPAPPNPADS